MENNTTVETKPVKEIERQLRRIKDELVRLNGYYIPTIHDEYLRNACKEILRGRNVEDILSEYETKLLRGGDFPDK